MQEDADQQEKIQAQERKIKLNIEISEKLIEVLFKCSDKMKIL